MIPLHPNPIELRNIGKYSIWNLFNRMQSVNIKKILRMTFHVPYVVQLNEVRKDRKKKKIREFRQVGVW